MRFRSIVIATVALLLASPALAAHVIVIDAPDANGDHTAAVQAALDECSFDGADCEIRFLAGTYRFANVSAENFHGVIKGAGMGNTILLPMPGQMAPDADYCLDGEYHFPVSNEVRWPVMMQFAGGDFKIANLTLSVPYFVYEGTEGWCGGFTGLASIILISGADTRSRIDGVAFEGNEPGGEPVWVGLFLTGGELFGKELSGSHSVVRSTFSSFFWAMAVAGGSGGSYRIGGDQGEGNVFDTFFGFEFNDMSDSRIVVSNNEMRAFNQGMWFGNLQYAITAPLASRYTIEKNRIRMTPGEGDGWWTPNAAIQLVDGMAFDGTPAHMLAEVTNNTIELVPSDQAGADAATGILVAFAHGALVANNKITGVGRTAIEVPEVGREATVGYEAWGVTERVTIRGNNVREFDASLARIHLGVGSRNCTVVGNKKDVLDEGLDNGVAPSAATKSNIKRR